MLVSLRPLYVPAAVTAARTGSVRHLSLRTAVTGSGAEEPTLFVSNSNW